MFETEQLKSLAALLDHLHLVTGYKFALLDRHGGERYSSSRQSAFCTQLKRAPGAYERCAACDAGMARRADDRRGFACYRCHAGLIEAAVPVTDGGRLTATVLFGQLLGSEPVAEQWSRTRALCSWHPDVDALRPAFFALRTVTEEQLYACARIVRACVSEVRFSSLSHPSPMRDGERLLAYIDSHYACALCTDALCKALSMGKTKLCAVARQESGMTVSRLIASRRVAAAQELLKNTDRPIQQIAECVGIPDYNYFTKVFKSLCGATPSAYRRQNRP